MEKKNFKTSLDAYGKVYITTIINKLRGKNKYSTGKLENSFSSDVIDVSSELSLELSSEDYIKFIDKGRAPGTWPSISALLKWASLKGISENAVYPIAKSIFAFGIPPTNIISDAFDSSLNALRRDSEEGWSKDVEELLNNFAKTE